MTAVLPTHTHTILVIEDEASVRESIRDLLALEHWACILAASWEEAQEKLGDQQPDLVVTDIQLPDITGYQICQDMKRDTVTKGIPVIMITGRFTEPQDRVQGFESGADEFFAKPFDPTYFIARIKSILRKAPTAS